MFVVGEIVGQTRLTKAYDAYVRRVLGDRLESIQRPAKRDEKGKARRPQAQFKIIKKMPGMTEYLELRNKRFTSSAESLMEEAYAEIAALAEEIREWYDNLTEGLQATEKAERLDEAANVLEGIEAQDATSLMAEVEVLHLPSLDTGSRAKRAAEAASILTDVAGSLRDYCELNRNSEEEETEPKEKSSEEKKATEEKAEVSWEDSDYDELESIADQLEEDAGEVEGVEFPGMFG